MENKEKKMKIEQIAIASIDPLALIENFRILGISNWTHDIVTAQGTVFGKNATNVAQLHFNYELGFELEVLKYEAGLNWHEEGDRNASGRSHFLSHIGLHVTEKEMEHWIREMETFGIDIAQEVITISHTNSAIAGKRKYRYVVFNSISKLGFDLKLIQRIDL
jgi:hypothetical protein